MCFTKFPRIFIDFAYGREHGGIFYFTPVDRICNRHRFLVRLLFGIRKHLLCLCAIFIFIQRFSPHMIIINYFTFPQ